jgi:hypothetical protein
MYEFYYKNKFEKLVHLVGFTIRIYHDASHLNVKSPVETKTTSSVQVLLFALTLTAASLVLYNLGRWQDTNI